MTTIQLYDPATLAGLLGTKTTDGYLDPVIRGIVPDSTRDDQLRAIQASPLGSHRSLAIGTPDILERLDTLLSIAPHFADALGIIRRAAVLSMHANSGLAIPPILLLGPPGVGKTFVARRIANALGVPMAEYSFASGDDPGALTGHSLSWRAARPGLVAKLLLEEDCANPLLFIDEVDKASSWRDDDPTDCLHALLEPENAARFADQFLELPLRADNIVWILTANDVAHLRPSLARSHGRRVDQGADARAADRGDPLDLRRRGRALRVRAGS